MFKKKGILLISDRLSPAVFHGFSTREGGVSRLPHTARMNVAEGHGDSPETVRENIGILARAVSEGTLGADRVICAPQIHSDRIRTVTIADAGTGVTLPAGEAGDGFCTDRPGVLLMVRTADCVPILFSAHRPDGSPLAAAVHAGWRGTVAGIAPKAVERLLAMGADLATVRAAVGPAIHSCCFQVQSDFAEAVKAARGSDFAKRHIKERNGSLYGDLLSMNRELLLEAGLTDKQIDLCPFCTVCDPETFHSHRASGGKRGAMGALIGIKPTNL